MSTGFSIVRQDRFIEATRDSGYKGTDIALYEFVDNAIQAQASSVVVQFIQSKSKMTVRDALKQPRVVQVLIADNGHGMDSDTLPGIAVWRQHPIRRPFRVGALWNGFTER